MVIVSAKISKRKVLLGLLAAVCLILVLTLLPGKNEAPEQLPTEDGVSLRGGTNDERLAFLQSYGWQVEPTPTQTQDVRIPQEFNDVFTKYNDLQKEQGFDLSRYAGKTAKRYVYAVANHPDGEPEHFATVLVHKNMIIGGDVTGAAGKGLHSFEMPD